MSIGDDIRILNREVRRLRNALERDPYFYELQQAAKLPGDRFQTALQHAIEENFLIFDESKKIVSEGEKLRNQPTPLGLYKPVPKKFLGFTPDQQPLWERIFLAVLSIGFILFLAYIAIQPEDLSSQKWKIIRLFASLNAAGIGAFLPGMLEVKGQRPSLLVRATGSLAAFVLVFWLF